MPVCAFAVAVVQELALRDLGHTRAEEHADQVLTGLEAQTAWLTYIHGARSVHLEEECYPWPLLLRTEFVSISPRSA